VLPQRQGLRFGTGDTLSPEFIALLLALVIYTAAFIAEIVRAGILAVPRGQLEAARALGLSYSQLLRMVILPQALRVIIPPLTNQYLNLAKNSSLAIAISFADIYQVMNTVGNQSGQSVAAITLVMLTYLVISLIISAIMNIVNARYQLVTR
jgi:general L-amino acid transport system permease protein